jgi:hypothetical protein
MRRVLETNSSDLYLQFPQITLYIYKIIISVSMYSIVVGLERGPLSLVRITEELF